MFRRPPIPTLFPYTTLFRSRPHLGVEGDADPAAVVCRNVDQDHEQQVASGSLEETCCSRSEEHTSELQSRRDIVCRLLLEKKKIITISNILLNYKKDIFVNC